MYDYFFEITISGDWIFTGKVKASSMDDAMKKATAKLDKIVTLRVTEGFKAAFNRAK